MLSSIQTMVKQYRRAHITLDSSLKTASVIKINAT